MYCDYGRFTQLGTGEGFHFDPFNGVKATPWQWQYYVVDRTAAATTWQSLDDQSPPQMFTVSGVTISRKALNNL